VHGDDVTAWTKKGFTADLDPRRLAQPVDSLLAELPATALTLRRVALRAGVPYEQLADRFLTVEAMLAEISLARLADAPLGSGRLRSPRERVIGELHALLTLMADQPLLGSACANAVMSSAAGVTRVRREIEAELSRRIEVALGYGAWPDLVEVLHWTLLGAIITAAGGAEPLEYVDERLGGFVELLLA
jgi:hypothetical protein